jgi:hypothetical protein
VFNTKGITKQEEGMSEKKEIFKLKTDEEISAYYRGVLIHKTIDLELLMEITIGRFLSMSNQERIYDLIEIFDFAIMDFSKKIKILKYIIKKYILEFLEYKSELTINRDKFFSNLIYIMERRNELAHKKLDLKSYDYLKLSWNIRDKIDKFINNEINLTKSFRDEYQMGWGKPIESL